MNDKEKKQRKILKALLDGETIEYKFPSGWRTSLNNFSQTVNAMSNDDEIDNYRVQPKLVELYSRKYLGEDSDGNPVIGVVNFRTADTLMPLPDNFIEWLENMKYDTVIL